MTDNKRPDRTTMEGMIWNANHVLEQALLPGVNGIPQGLFGSCLGLVLISVVEAGFIFTGNVGTGIMLAKKPDGSWSKPGACGLTGVGWGIVVGGSIKDVIIFILDEASLNGLVSDAGVRMGGQLELTLGPIGRTAKVDLDVTNRGVGGTLSIAFSKGAFLGIGIEGGLVGARNAVNSMFYGKELSPRQILFEDQGEFPTNKVTLMDQVYDKLNKLSQGGTAEPSAEEEEHKSAAFAEAEKSASDANLQPDVVKVDAAAEAAKEAAAS